MKNKFYKALDTILDFFDGYVIVIAETLASVGMVCSVISCNTACAIVSSALFSTLFIVDTIKHKQ